MSYSVVRGQTLFGRFGSLAVNVLATVIYTGLTLFSIAHLHPGDNILLMGGAFLVSLAIGIAIHETGHLVVGLAVGEHAKQLRVGSGATLFALRIRSVVIQICINPIGGGVVYFSSLDAVPGARRIASLAAGPGINLLAAAYSLALWEGGVTWLGVFAFANALCFISGALPYGFVAGGRLHKSDGLQILDALFKPSLPATFFDGGDMTTDACAVLVRAMDDANLSGLPEVSDEHLLRALALDPMIAGLFKAHGVDRKIPRSPTPESDDVSGARWSRTTLKILQTAFQKSRDLGNPRPNAAGLCLALVAVDCPAGQLLKGAGIAEDVLRNLAAQEIEDEASKHRAQIVSSDLPLDRWGDAADKALARAYQIAEMEHSTYVGTQEILAALVADAGCRAARALDRLRFRLVWKPSARSNAEEESVRKPLLSVQGELAVAGALWRTGLKCATGTAELLLGIVDENAGIGAQLLVSSGVTVDALINALRLTDLEASQPTGCTTSIRHMWERRAFARLRDERWMDARRDFQVVESIAITDDQRALARNNIAWVSLLANDPSLNAEALALSKSALAIKPNFASFVGTHAFALLVNGSAAEAAALLEPVASSHARARDRADDLAVLAMCYAHLGRRDDATEKLAAAEAANPKCVLLARAQAEVDQGRELTGVDQAGAANSPLARIP